MKKRFTATVALITLLSSSTVPTLTQAAEQLKVSQPNTTGDSSQNTDQEEVATSSADTTTERRQNTDTTKKVSSQTKESTTQTTTTEAKDGLSSERTAAIKEIQKLSALNNKESYIAKINNAKTKSEINTVVTTAQDENTKVLANKKARSIMVDAINNATQTINKLSYLDKDEKDSFIHKIDIADNVDDVNHIVEMAKEKNNNREEAARKDKEEKVDSPKTNSHNQHPNNSKPTSSQSDEKSLNKEDDAGKDSQQPSSFNRKKDSNKGHNGGKTSQKPQHPNNSKPTSSQSNEKSSNKAVDAGKGTTKTAVAKPKQKYKKSTSSYKATQRQAMAAAAIAKLDDELQIGADENPVKITPNMTGKEFIEAIADYATEVADKNDLYASVMIAQACLESGFGTSGLASSPYYNLFGIKGAYKGKSVHMQTLEDGSNGMYSINAGFRDYPSPKESLEDYADLLSTNFYKGAHKSKTSTYRDATRFLTGRYATDRNYARKLNGIIEAYDLTQYDEGNGKLKRIKKITNVYYKVKPGDTIKSIAKAHHNSVKELKEWNKKTLKDVNLIYPGQKIIADQKVTYKYIKVKDSDDKQAAKNGKFNLPLKKGSYTVTSPFGGRKAPNAAAGNYHEGIDLAVPMNSNVYAARDGVVFATGYDGSAGNYIFLYHGNGLFSNYFHLTSAKVKVGDHVNAGDLIAKSGSTGNSTGPHLHFGISHRLWGDYENPEDYLNFK